MRAGIYVYLHMGISVIVAAGLFIHFHVFFSAVFLGLKGFECVWSAKQIIMIMIHELLVSISFSRRIGCETINMHAICQLAIPLTRL